MEWTISEELVAKAIGKEVMKHIEPGSLTTAVNKEMEQILKEIQEAINDDSLDDMECFRKIEAIITTFQQRGVPTSRHDFG